MILFIYKRNCVHYLTHHVAQKKFVGFTNHPAKVGVNDVTSLET